MRETPRRGAVERHYKSTSRRVSARNVIEWVLAPDGVRPPGWQARAVGLDEQGFEALAAAVTRFWADVDKAERASTRRNAGSVRRTGVAVVHAPDVGI